MPKGTVTAYDAEKGIGTIEEEKGGEIRVYRSGLGEEGQSVLYRGDVVEFQIGRHKRGGRIAVGVVRIGWEEEPAGDAPREWNF